MLAPRGLARAAARLIAALDEDGVAPEDESEPSDEVRIGRRADGSLVLKGRFTGRADIALSMEAFDALSGRAGAEDDRTLEARYAATFLELCGLAMSPGGIGSDVAPEDRADPREATGPTERGEGDPANLLPDQRHQSGRGPPAGLSLQRRRALGRRSDPPGLVGARPRVDGRHRPRPGAGGVPRCRERPAAAGPRHTDGRPRRRPAVLIIDAQAALRD